jgi:hypothetical protein
MELEQQDDEKLNHGGDARDSDRDPQGLADSVAKID